MSAATLRLAGKVVIVTGASSGIGAAVAEALGAAGAQVIAAARREERLRELAARIEAGGGRATPIVADVSREADVERLFATVVEQHGRVDQLVHSAGIADHTPIEDLPLERWNEVIGANLTSSFLCARAAIRAMKPRGCGRILMIGSLSALVPRAGTPAYAASKAGLAGLTHSLAIDGRKHGIAVSVFHPGVVRTELGASATAPPGRVMEADDTARMILAMLDLPDDANFYQGVALPLAMDFLGRG